MLLEGADQMEEEEKEEEKELVLHDHLLQLCSRSSFSWLVHFSL